MVITIKARSTCIARISILVLFVAMGSCGGPSMRVPVTRPAEIYLKEPRKVLVNDLNGEGGPAIAASLTRQLVQTGRFEVYDRARLEQKLRESNPSMKPNAMQVVTSVFLDRAFRPGKRGLLDRNAMEALLREADPNLVGPDQKMIAAELEKLVGGGYAISGEVTTYSYVQKESSDQPTKDAQGKQHRTFKKQGTANVAASVQITNLSAGTIVAMKNISKSVGQETTAQDARPLDPDGNALLDQAANGAVASFVRLIVPHTDYVHVSFAKNEQKIPEMDQGVNYARSGLWPEAAEQFKAATQKSPANQGAWWDLGVAYEYSYRFQEAEEALKQAAKIAPCDRCAREIQNVRWLAEQRKTLEEQGER